MKFQAATEGDLATVCQQFLKTVQDYKIFALKGEMGVGKTTFISYLAKEIGIAEETSSPTFGYVKEYEIPGGLLFFHMDLYRIESEEEALDIGIEEYLDGENWVFIEWAENIQNLLSENCVWITITKDEHEIRTIEVEIES